MSIFIHRHNCRKASRLQSGQAALIVVIMFLFVSLVVAGAFAFMAVSELSGARDLLYSKKTFVTSESGMEESIFRRVIKNDFESQMAISLNGGEATITQNTVELGINTSYVVASTGQIKSYYRKNILEYKLPDGSNEVGIKNTFGIGALGMQFGGNSSIACVSATCDQATFFTNGSIAGAGSSDQIRGNVSIARGHNNIPQLKNEGTSDQWLNIRDTSSTLDGAQSFIAPYTGYITKIAVFVKMSSAASNLGGLSAIRIVGNRHVGGIDVPDNIGDYGSVTSSAYLTSISVGTTAEWIPITINTNPDKPLISNEKYWLVFSSDTTSANYYMFGSLDSFDQSGDDDLYYTYNLFESFVDPNEPQRFLRFDDYISWTPGVTLPSPSGRDILFKIYFGKEKNDIDGGSSQGKFTVTGDVRAEKVVGVDIWGQAYYQNVNTSPSPGPHQSPDANKNETIAGGAVIPASPTSKNYDYSGGAGCLTNTVGAFSNATCNEDGVVMGYRCRAPMTENSATPMYGRAIGEFCQCVDSDISSSYCHYDAAGAELTDFTGMFTRDIGPIVTGNWLKERKDMVTGGPRPPSAPAGNWTEEVAQTRGSSQKPYSFRIYTQGTDNGGVDGTGVDSWWINPDSGTYYNNLPTLFLDGTKIQSSSYTSTYPGPQTSSATTTLQLPAIINGNLHLRNSGTDIGRIELSSGAPTPSITDFETQPFILWIKGNLYMQNGSIISKCSIMPVQPTPSDIPSITIIVEGLVKIESNCMIRGYSVDLKSYVNVVSLHPGVGLNNESAMYIRGISNGSAYFAPRGGILLDNFSTEVLKLRAVAANYLRVNGGTDVQYMQDNPTIPYSEFGGTFPVDVDVIKFHEIE